MTQTTKPARLTATLRRLIIANQTMPTKDLQTKMTQAGFARVKMSTIQTIRADTLATIREATALGLLVTPGEPKPELSPARPRRSRSRARSEQTEQASP